MGSLVEAEVGKSGSRGFPLYDRAVEAGVLETGQALIVAPPATGKSYIGRAIIREGLWWQERGVRESGHIIGCQPWLGNLPHTRSCDFVSEQ